MSSPEGPRYLSEQTLLTPPVHCTRSLLLWIVSLPPQAAAPAAQFLPRDFARRMEYGTGLRKATHQHRDSSTGIQKPPGSYPSCSRTTTVRPDGRANGTAAVTFAYSSLETQLGGMHAGRFAGRAAPITKRPRLRADGRHHARPGHRSHHRHLHP